MRIGFLSTAYHTSHVLRHYNIIEAEWKLFGTGVDIIRAFERKEIDLAYVGLTPTILGISKGLEIVCVAGGHVEGTAIAGRKLEGARIGVPSKGSIHDVILRATLEKENIEAEVVNYPWADMILEDYIDGKLDAVCGTPNLIVLAKKHGAEIFFHPKELFPFNPSYGIVVRKSALERINLADFLIKHEWACNLLKEARGVVSKSLSEYFNGLIDPKTMEEILSLSPKYCSSLPREYIDCTMELLEVMKKLGYIEKVPKERDVFDTELIERLHPQKHHYS